MNERIGGGQIAGAEVRGVPVDLFAGAHGDIAEQGDFGQIAGIIDEIRHRRRSALASRQPFRVMALVGSATQRWLGRLVTFECFRRQQDISFAIIIRRVESSFGPDQQTAAADRLLSLEKLPSADGGLRHHFKRTARRLPRAGNSYVTTTPLGGL